MEEKNYKYDAFISYRHSELDKYVAENMHRVLENYELPKNLKEKLNINGKVFKRIFRDREELPLSSNLEDPIISALNDSKYLIVICSPRLKDSLWCKKEIQTFKKLRGRKNIFCVLVEGEPNESFPEEVLYDEKKTGNKTERVLVEPLAADVRGTTKKEVNKKIKEEKLRLVASMLNIDYDDLKQRHKQREQRRKLLIATAIASFFILFSLYTSIMLIKINKQRNTLKLHQASTLSTKSEEYLKIDDRYDAIKSSYEALTKFDGVKMPYTSEAEYALSESLGVYDMGYSYKAIDEYKTKGVVDYIKSSYERTNGATYDESGTVTLFNTKTLNIIKEFNVNGNLFSEESFSFIGDDKLAFVNNKGNITIVNSEGKKIDEIEKVKLSYIGLQGNNDGSILIYTDGKELFIYNVNEKKEVGKISTDDRFYKKIYLTSSNEYLFAITEPDTFETVEKEQLTIHTINVKEAKEINSTVYDAGYINGVVTKDDNVFFLLNNINGNNFEMIVSSYNYKNGNRNWIKSFNGMWGKIISRSYPEGTNNIVAVNRDKVNVLNADNGDPVESFDTDSELINLYSYLDDELYLAFLSNGSVNYINMRTRTAIEYKGKYDFHLDSYIAVSQSSEGFILLPKNSNRVILYEIKSNKKGKEEDISLDYVSDDSVTISDLVEIKKQYSFKNINLVERCIYNNDKSLMFVNYNNGDLAIYNTKDKSLIKYLDNVGNINHYFGKDKYNRIYIGDISNSYILDSNYNKVGHIEGLAKLEKDKVIITHNSKYYSIKIYTLDDLLKEAKDYLK